jgi:hypothetical protein
MAWHVVHNVASMYPFPGAHGKLHASRPSARMLPCNRSCGLWSLHDHSLHTTLNKSAKDDDDDDSLHMCGARARLSSYALDLTHLIHAAQASIIAPMRCVAERTTTKARVPPPARPAGTLSLITIQCVLYYTRPSPGSCRGRTPCEAGDEVARQFEGGEHARTS